MKSNASISFTGVSHSRSRIAVGVGIIILETRGSKYHTTNISFFFQAEDGIRDLVRSRGLGDVYKRQGVPLTTKQHYYGVDMAYNLSRTLVASLLGEMSTLKDEKNYRVNFSIIKRFDSKNKK